MSKILLLICDLSIKKNLQKNSILHHQRAYLNFDLTISCKLYFYLLFFLGMFNFQGLIQTTSFFGDINARPTFRMSNNKMYRKRFVDRILELIFGLHFKRSSKQQRNNNNNNNSKREPRQSHDHKSDLLFF